MFLYIKTNILRGYGIFKNDFAHPREPANLTANMLLCLKEKSAAHKNGFEVLRSQNVECNGSGR